MASESTMHPILRQEKQNIHRRSEKAPVAKPKPKALIATQSNQVWTRDITYLSSSVFGQYFYLYYYIDIFDRASLGWQVFESESTENAALLLKDIYETNCICPEQLTLHSDNGSSIKGQTMQTMMVSLGIANSNSRPRVSNDNALSESLFKTLKYHH